MAHHFNENTIANFKQLPSVVTYQGYRPLTSNNGWNKDLVLRNSGTSDGSFPYHDIYRTPTDELPYFPMYNLVQGLPTINPASIYAAGHSVDANSLVRDMYRKKWGRDISLSPTLNQIYRDLPGVNQNYACMSAIASMYSRFRGMVEGDANTFLQEIDNIVEASLDIPMRYYTVIPKHPLKGTYFDLHTSLGAYFHTMLRSCTFKAGTIVSGFGTLVDIDRSIILGMLTVKAEFLQYYILCRLHQVPVNMEIFTLVVDEQFAEGNREYAKELYKVFKKGVQDVLPQEVEITYIKGEELFPLYFGDKYDFEGDCLGPIEQIEQNTIIQDEMLNARNSTEVLRRAGIRITM